MTTATKLTTNPAFLANTSIVRPPSLLKQLRLERSARIRDEETRMALGLIYIGIEYGPFNRAPRQLYRDDLGRYFVKIANSNYQEIPK